LRRPPQQILLNSFKAMHVSAKEKGHFQLVKYVLEAAMKLSWEIHSQRLGMAIQVSVQSCWKVL